MATSPTLNTLAPLAGALLLLAGALDVRASTAAEREAMQKSPPHLAPGKGKDLRVNWARQLTFPGGENKAKELARELKEEYAACVASLRPPLRAKPVREWPDYQQVSVTDSYVSDFGQVQYETGVVYLFSSSMEWGCELKEHVVKTAKVTSPLGLCKVRISEGTASGVCSAFRAHVLKEMEAGGKGFTEPNPGVHPMSGLLVTDERRTIEGFPCRVMQHASGGIKTCVAESKAFGGYQGYHAVPLGGYTALTLWREQSGVDVHIRATDGRMNFLTGRDLLFPFRAPGIKVSEEKPFSGMSGWDDEP